MSRRPSTQGVDTRYSLEEKRRDEEAQEEGGGGGGKKQHTTTDSETEISGSDDAREEGFGQSIGCSCASEVCTCYGQTTQNAAIRKEPIIFHSSPWLSNYHAIHPSESQTLTISFGSARDEIRCGYRFNPSNDSTLYPQGRLAMPDQIYGQHSFASKVIVIMVDTLTSQPASWLREHKQVHFIFDYDGVIENSYVKMNPPQALRSTKGLTELESTYKTSQIEAQKYHDYQEEFFGNNQSFGSANLTAAEYGLYQSDKLKISRLLNAILGEDSADRIHVFVDDREDILTAVYNFFKRYPHLIQGKLVLYKTLDAHILKLTDGEIEVPAGTLTRCHWKHSVQLSTPEQAFYTLEEPDYRAPIGSFAEFSKDHATPSKQRTFEENDQFHAMWGAYLARAIIQDAKQTIGNQTSAHIEQSCVVDGTGKKPLPCTNLPRQLAFILNSFDPSSSDLEPEKVAHLLNRFHEEIQAAHFISRKPEGEQRIPRDNLGQIAPLAAVVTAHTSKILDGVNPSTADAELQDLLEHFPCQTLPHSFMRLLKNPPLVTATSSTLAFSTAKSWRSVRSQASDLELQSTVADEPQDAQGLELGPMPETDPVESYSQLLTWLARFGVNPPDIFNTPEARTTSLGPALKKVMQAAFFSTATSSAIELSLVFLPFAETVNSVLSQAIYPNAGDQNAPIPWITPGDTTATEICQASSEELSLAIMMLVVHPSGGQDSAVTKGIVTTAAGEWKAALRVLEQAYIEQSLPKDGSLGKTYLNLNWMSRVARSLLTDYITFRESPAGSIFFEDLADCLDLPCDSQNFNRIHAMQNAWQILLQALALGHPQVYVTVPADHEPSWYEHLYKFCQTYLFRKPEARAHARRHDQVDIQTVMARGPEDLRLRPTTLERLVTTSDSKFPATAQTYADLEAPTEPDYTKPLVDALIAPFIHPNNTLHAPTVMATTRPDIQKFVNKMFRSLISLSTDQPTATNVTQARLYVFALQKLMDTPLEGQATPLDTSDLRIIFMCQQHHNEAQQASKILTPLLTPINPPSFLENMRACPIKPESTLLHDLYEHLADPEGGKAYTEAFLKIPFLKQLFERYTLLSTNNMVLFHGKRISNPFSRETNPGLFKKFIEDFLCQPKEDHPLWLLVLALLLQYPYNQTSSMKCQSVKKHVPLTDADVRLATHQKRLDDLKKTLPFTVLTRLHQILTVFIIQLCQDKPELFKKFAYQKLCEFGGMIIPANEDNDQVASDVHKIRPPNNTAQAWRFQRKPGYVVWSVDPLNQAFAALTLGLRTLPVSDRPRRELICQALEVIGILLMTYSAATAIGVLNDLQVHNATGINTTTDIPQDMANRDDAILGTLVGLTLGIFALRAIAASGSFEKGAPTLANIANGLSFLVAAVTGAYVLVYKLPLGWIDKSPESEALLSMIKGYIAPVLLLNGGTLSQLLSKALSLLACQIRCQRGTQVGAHLVLNMLAAYGGWTWFWNAIGDAVFNLGYYASSNATLDFPAEAIGNLLTGVLAPGFASAFALFTAADFLLQNYKFSWPYLILAVPAVLLALGVDAASFINFVLPVLEFLNSNSTATIPPLINTTAIYSNVIINSELGLIALFALCIVGIAYGNKDFKSTEPYLSNKNPACCSCSARIRASKQFAGREATGPLVRMSSDHQRNYGTEPGS